MFALISKLVAIDKERMGSSGKQKTGKDVKRTKTAPSTKARSGISKHRRQHPNGREDMMDEDDSTDVRDSDEGDEDDDEQSVVESKSSNGLTAAEKLGRLVEKKMREMQQKEAQAKDSGGYKGDSTITSRNTDSQRTPATSRTGQLVTPVARGTRSGGIK